MDDMEPHPYITGADSIFLGAREFYLADLD